MSATENKTTQAQYYFLYNKRIEQNKKKLLPKEEKKPKKEESKCYKLGISLYKRISIIMRI